MLFEGLNSKMEKWTSKQKLADVFLFMAEFLKTYTDYINNYDNAQTTLIRCSENKAFAKFLFKTSQDPICGGQSLFGYLIMPVQRVPRYALLLRELEKCTPEDHPDFENLKVALSKILDINDYLNEKKRVAESSFKLLEITENLIGKASIVIQPYRHFISDHPILLTCNETKQKQTQGKLFIFSDALMYTRNAKKGKQKILDIISYFYVRKFMTWEGETLKITYQNNIAIAFNDKSNYNDVSKSLNGALEDDRLSRSSLRVNII